MEKDGIATSGTQNTRELSLGEARVRTEFNPSQDGTVDRIKQKTAQLINEIQFLKDQTHDPKVARLCALAQTSYEEAAMWAVIAATAKK